MPRDSAWVGTDAASGAGIAAEGPTGTDTTGTDTTGAGGEAGPGSHGDTDAHAASVPKIAAIQGLKDMWLILLEALAALAILVLIVWWTMFSGRKKGERIDDEP
jgi:hypothetical protein